MSLIYVIPDVVLTLLNLTLLPLNFTSNTQIHKYSFPERFILEPNNWQTEPLNDYLKYLKIIMVSENSGKVVNLYYPCPSPSADTQTHTPLQTSFLCLDSLFFSPSIFVVSTNTDSPQAFSSFGLILLVIRTPDRGPKRLEWCEKVNQVEGMWVLVTQPCPTPLRPHGLSTARLLCSWNSPGKNTEFNSHSLLQGIFLTQDWTQVSCIAGGFFTNWASREAW